MHADQQCVGARWAAEVASVSDEEGESSLQRTFGVSMITPASASMLSSLVLIGPSCAAIPPWMGAVRATDSQG